MFDINPQLDQIITTALQGSVVQTIGMTASVADFPAPVGALVEIERQSGPAIDAEVIGFRDENTIVFPFGSMNGVRRGSPVRLVKSNRTIRVGDQLLGRVINANGRCIDGKPQPILSSRTRLDASPPVATERPRIDEPIATGVRAIDSMLTCGKGQRMGIFAGSGVGKSVLLGMMARYSSADIIVITLIGERGREVNEFIERDLGPEGLRRSVVIVATSDEPALSRVHSADTGTAVAEYFRDQGKDVLLLMDSITRYAMAQREIGLAAGEPPTTRGYPPSVFAMLPKLVERAGRTNKGSITAFYSVLVEGDDQQEPIADTVRGLLDGHTWLSRSLASRGHFPAIDVLDSLSRLFPEVSTAQQKTAAQTVRELLSAYQQHEDLISIGAYRRGSNPRVDTAIEAIPIIEQFLRQSMDEHQSLDTTRTQFCELASRFAAPPAGAPAATN